MLILLPLLLSVTGLHATIGVERRFYTRSIVKPKRGVIEINHNVPQTYKFQHLQNVRGVQSPGPSPQFKAAKIVPQESSLILSASPVVYHGAFKPSTYGLNLPLVAHPAESRSNEQLSPHHDAVFTMSAGYKVAGDANGIHSKQSSANLQVPVYKTSYPLSRASDYRSRNPLEQKSQEHSGFSSLSSFRHQPASTNIDGHRFDFPGRASKAGNVQLSGVPFLSPLSSFQGQVVAISTAASNPQFPQYKGATVEVYPTVGALSAPAYQPLQAQPQLHFAHGNVQHVQPVDNIRHSSPSQEIRSDVEIIDKKKPRPPPKDDDDGDDEDDEGYTPHGSRHGPNTEVESDYKPGPERYFKSPSTKSTYEPTSSFPFSQYDETFGKYSKQRHGGEDERKPFGKPNDYSPLSEDKDDEAASHSEDTSPKSYYSRQEDAEEEEEEEDAGHEYEKQRAEESSDDEPRSKYFDKDFDEEFEASSYRRVVPRERHARAKEVPGAEYGSRSSRRSRGSYERNDPSSRKSGTASGYRKISDGLDDVEGHGSDAATKAIPRAITDGSFGYKIQQKKL